MNKNYTDMLELLLLCSGPGNQSKIYDLLSGVSAYRTNGIFRLIVLLNAFLRQMQDKCIISEKDYYSLEKLCNSALDYIEEYKKE